MLFCVWFCWSPAGRLVGIHPRGEVVVFVRSPSRPVLEAVRQAAQEGLGVGLGESLGAAQAALLLGGLGARDVASAGRTIHQLALGGQFEAFGNGLFGLLHDDNGDSGAGQKTGCAGGCKEENFLVICQNKNLSAGGILRRKSERPGNLLPDNRQAGI
jgi:hypothetical protein